MDSTLGMWEVTKCPRLALLPCLVLSESLCEFYIVPMVGTDHTWEKYNKGETCSHERCTVFLGVLHAGIMNLFSNPKDLGYL